MTVRRSSSASCSVSAAPTSRKLSSARERPGPRRPRGRDLTDYGISYLTLATEWAGSAFQRLVGAHVRGEDVIALDTARKLARFRDLASAKADEMGFPKNSQQFHRGNGPPPRFYFLTQLDELLRDQERRAKMPPRTPIPKKGGEPAARIAALIRDLDLIDARQMSSPGAANPGSSPLVRDLIAEGDPAVAPLLEVLEFDNRLTRSVSHGRGMSIESFVHPVYEAAVAALIGILNTHEFDQQRYSTWTTPDPRRGGLSRIRCASSGKRRARFRWSSAGIGPCLTTLRGRLAGWRRPGGSFSGKETSLIRSANLTRCR